MCQNDSVFRVLLRGGPPNPSLKMWFQALESSVSRTVAEYFATSTSLLLALQQNENTRPQQYEKLKIQAPGTLFSNFSDKVRPEGALICSATFWLDGSVRSSSRKTKRPQEKKKRSDVVQVSLLSGVLFVLCGQCNTGVFRGLTFLGLQSCLGDIPVKF